MFTRSLCFLLSTLYAAIALAQSVHADCSNALFVCDKKPLVINQLTDAGAQIESAQMSCLDKPFTETNSIWLRFKIEKPGSLAFVLSPHDAQNDLDFVLYRTLPEADCNAPHEALRCMTAGPNLGETDGGTGDCTNETGLKDRANEIHRNSGCRAGQDNFLKPVEVREGDSYLLWINNFRAKGGLNITWAGTATFRPDPAHCTLSGLAQDLGKGGLSFSAPYPNPTSQSLRLDVRASADQNGQYQLFRADGSLAMTRSCVLPGGSSSLDIATETLPTGVYFIKFSFGNAVHVVKFGKE